LLEGLPERTQSRMKRLFLILGDQLHPDPHPLLADFNPASDQLLMVLATFNEAIWSASAA
jgi:deoxyribodipyrimidine photolyase-related protein